MTVILGERQKRILKEAGLSQDYESLSLTQKSAIESIEQMLTYLETTYNEPFSYRGYIARGILDKEQLFAYPEKGNENDVVTVTRSYQNDVFIYTDNYTDFLALPTYHDALTVYFDNVVGKENYKLFLKIRATDRTFTPENVLRQANSSGCVVLRNIIDEKRLHEISAAYGNWILDQSNGSRASVMTVFLVPDALFYDINESNYEEQLRNGYIERTVCSVSADGTLYFH